MSTLHSSMVAWFIFRKKNKKSQMENVHGYMCLMSIRFSFRKGPILQQE